MRSVPRPRHLAAARFGTRGGSYKCCGAEGRSRDATAGARAVEVLAAGKRRPRAPCACGVGRGPRADTSKS